MQRDLQNHHLLLYSLSPHFYIHIIRNEKTDVYPLWMSGSTSACKWRHFSLAVLIHYHKTVKKSRLVCIRKHRYNKFHYGYSCFYEYQKTGTDSLDGRDFINMELCFNLEGKRKRRSRHTAACNEKNTGFGLMPDRGTGQGAGDLPQ